MKGFKFKKNIKNQEEFDNLFSDITTQRKLIAKSLGLAKRHRKQSNILKKYVQERIKDPKKRMKVSLSVIIQLINSEAWLEGYKTAMKWHCKKENKSEQSAYKKGDF